MHKDELSGITMEELRLLGDQITASAKSLRLIDNESEVYGVVRKGGRFLSSHDKYDAGYHFYCSARGIPLDHPANPDGTFIGHTKKEAYLCLKKILGGLVLVQGAGVRKYYEHRFRGNL